MIQFYRHPLFPHRASICRYGFSSPYLAFPIFHPIGYFAKTSSKDDHAIITESTLSSFVHLAGQWNCIVTFYVLQAVLVGGLCSNVPASPNSARFRPNVDRNGKKRVGMLLTPKILCAFWPNSTVFDIVGKINFSKNYKYANLRK
jgi:hypothetical protein